MTDPSSARGGTLGGLLDLHARARRNALHSLRSMQDRRADAEEAEQAVQTAEGVNGCAARDSNPEPAD